MKMLVTGAAGHLGAAIVREFAQAYDVIALGRRDLDISDAEAVRNVVGRHAPDAIVNTAAYNEVDRAEQDSVNALRANGLAVLALAREAADRGAAFVHYGSDFVFDGRTDRPYTEEDRPNPESVYGVSKLLGERFAQDTPRSYVLRVESIFGGPTAGSGARLGSGGGIVAAIEAGREVPVFTDRVVTVSHAGDVAAATRHVLETRTEPGLYHCVNSGLCRWDEFAREAARLLGKDAKLRPITLDSVKLPAARPRYSALSNEKLARAGFVMPSWQDALRRYLESRSAIG